MRTQLILTLLLGLTLGPSSIASPRFSPDRIVVKLKPHAILPDFASAKTVHHLFGQVYVVNVESGIDNIKNAETFFNSHSEVEYVERDFQAEKAPFEKPQQPSPRFRAMLQADPTPPVFNDPKVNDQWAFRSAAGFGISVNDAYREFAANGQQIIVAIIDTGIEYSHEDLKDNIWVNTLEIPENGIDDDGNGYIDDIHGINTLIRDSSGKATTDIMDTMGHGTHVAGIIGAVQNNGRGIAGIARNIKLMALRTVPNDADEKDVDIAEAMIYAAKNGAKVINCSFGKRVNEGGQLIPDTIQYIGEQFGVLVVAASGNDSQEINDQNKLYPASYQKPNFLVVSSTSSSGKLSYFSNFGAKYVHVAAPGSAIYSTYLGSDYAFLSGTSMACPNAVGVAAQILSLHPELNPVQLRNLILESVTPVSSLAQKVSTGGRIDLKQALIQANQ